MELSYLIQETIGKFSLANTFFRVLIRQASQKVIPMKKK